MANWWRFTVEQEKYSHWFQIHPFRMEKMEIWMNKMLKKYPDLKIYMTLEADFEKEYVLEFDKKYNLIKFTQNNYRDNFDFDYKYYNSDVFYYKDFPNNEVNLRKLKLENIDKIVIR